jgi:ATP-dependent RNA circularization protein (DNA/RNA ligase family)
LPFINPNKIIENCYGSIPHLSNSKMFQKADKKITMGQELILTQKARDKQDLIIVTEKLDGSGVGVIKKENKLIPLVRKGYTADSSEYKQHKFFRDYVVMWYEKFFWIPEGWRVCGEWMVQVHGMVYDVTDEPLFCAFDIFDDKNQRLTYDKFTEKCWSYGIKTVQMIHKGLPISVENALKLLEGRCYGKVDKPEGIVYRVERNGKVDFLAKWVRPDKEDGKYMTENRWNIGAKEELAGYGFDI